MLLFCIILLYDKIIIIIKSCRETTTEQEEVSSNWDESTPTFDLMDLKEDLLRGIYAYGYEKPSAIQQKAIKPILMGRDVIAQAQSGM